MAGRAGWIALTLRGGEAETYRLLREAVLRREQVLALYRGFPIVFCPHVLGRHQGEAKVLGYEMVERQGPGVVREPIGSPRLWRLISIRDLRAVRTRVGFWVAIAPYLRPPIDGLEADVATG